jgi:lipopolysaccharide biosynthesis glycosyltransferase
LFDLESTKKYDKILYLDTDVIVKGDIRPVFDLCVNDVLYVLEEGAIDDPHDYWGKTLFGNEIHNYKDRLAFTSGILLFNNCDKIKDLFEKIKEDIINRPYQFACFDQPYIVYNAFKYNMYEKKLDIVAVNNDHNIYSNKVIHHFPGGPGVYQHKIIYMANFLNKLKNYSI